MSMTTTRSIFRVEDVSFKNPRKQSEILNEGVRGNEVEVKEVEPPKSLTPEQVIKFYEESISATDNLDAKRVYSQTIKWIKELLEARSIVKTYREKELVKLASNEVSDDIGE